MGATLKMAGALGLALSVGLSPACESEGGPEAPTGKSATQSAPFRYLIANGTFTLAPDAPGWDDPRNPRRVVLATSDAPGSASEFSFYADVDGAEPLAEGCTYQYNRTQPDQALFPIDSDAIWIMFELLEGAPAACEAYDIVAFTAIDDASAEAGEARLSMRYGSEGYDALVSERFSLSDAPEVWWNHYTRVDDALPALPAPPYLQANGEWELSGSSAGDPRNPGKVELQSDVSPVAESRFTFYAQDDPTQVIADCGTIYRYTMPDPLAFPADKTGLWHAFSVTETQAGECEAFAYVLMWWRDGKMSLRYGTEGFEPLLIDSVEPLDGQQSWWSEYCPAGEALCP